MRRHVITAILVMPWLVVMGVGIVLLHKWNCSDPVMHCGPGLSPKQFGNWYMPSIWLDYICLVGAMLTATRDM
jgi:hypothetical protein